MNGLDIFPTKLFEFQINQEDSFNLLNEILRNENKLKIISSTRSYQNIKEYVTDFPFTSESKTVQLENLDKVFDDIKIEFDRWNSSFQVLSYWTAIYAKTGYHGMHNHFNGILDKCNYSGIIYLSDIGRTIFYSTSPSSFEVEFISNSKMGKVLIFPSSLPHAVEPTFHEENKRYIISFNCEIRKK